MITCVFLGVHVLMHKRINAHLFVFRPACMGILVLLCARHTRRDSKSVTDVSTGVIVSSRECVTNATTGVTGITGVVDTASSRNANHDLFVFLQVMLDSRLDTSFRLASIPVGRMLKSKPT